MYIRRALNIFAAIVHVCETGCFNVWDPAPNLELNLPALLRRGILVLDGWVALADPADMLVLAVAELAPFFFEKPAHLR